MPVLCGGLVITGKCIFHGESRIVELPIRWKEVRGAGRSGLHDSYPT